MTDKRKLMKRRKAEGALAVELKSVIELIASAGVGTGRLDAGGR